MTGPWSLFECLSQLNRKGKSSHLDNKRVPHAFALKRLRFSTSASFFCLVPLFFFKKRKPFFPSCRMYLTNISLFCLFLPYHSALISVTRLNWLIRPIRWKSSCGSLQESPSLIAFSHLINPSPVHKVGLVN